MNRVSLLLVACLVACGGSKPKQQNLAPLPDDKPTEQAKPQDTAKPAEPAPEPKPLPPVEVTVDVPPATIKLVSAGRGKKAPLKYVPTAGSKQQVEMVTRFAQTAAVNGESGEQAVPPIVLAGEAETKAVDASGKAEYALVMASVDARDEPNNAVPAEKFKVAIASLAGLVISGSVEPNGVTTASTLRIEKPDQFTTGALDLLKATLPTWPVFPKEPIGVGAKWKATRTHILRPTAAVAIEMEHVTDYELVAIKGKTATIKSKTKITGKDQTLPDTSKISKISGTGTAEITIEQGALYPSYTSNLESKLTVTAPDKSEQQHGFKIANSVTAKPKQ